MVDELRQPYYIDESEPDCWEVPTLLGPDGFRCELGEPEDRTWWQDGKPAVDELNRLYAETIRLEAQLEEYRRVNADQAVALQRPVPAKNCPELTDIERAIIVKHLKAEKRKAVGRKGYFMPLTRQAWPRERGDKEKYEEAKDRLRKLTVLLDKFETPACKKK